MASPYVTIQGKYLKRAVRTAAKALPRNSPNVAWNHVVLHIDVISGIYAYATNGTQTVVAGIGGYPSTSESMPTSFLLNDACLKCIATAGDDELVRISREEHPPVNHVVVRLDKARFKFDVPAIPVASPNTVSWDNRVEFQREHFDDLVKLLGGVGDDENMDFDMSGVQIIASDDPSVFIATSADPRRVVQGRFPAAVTSNPENVEGVIPRSLLKLAKSIESDEPVSVTFTDRSCFIKTGDTVCEGLLSEGRFPPTAAAFRQMHDHGRHAGDVNRRALLYGLRCAEITTNRNLDHVGVRLTGKGDRIEFASEAPDRGKSYIVRESHLASDFDVTVDPSLMVPVLAGLPDDTVSLAVLGNDSIQIGTPVFRCLAAGIVK